MCVVSMVGDHYNEKWRRMPWVNPMPPYRVYPPIVWPPRGDEGPEDEVPFVRVSREEFDALKREVEDMKTLLIRAKDYDERNGEPHCEMDDKVTLLKKVAELVGVSLDDVFGSKP